MPYAYQCCAFWGCDSYLNSDAEDSSHQDQGTLVDREKGKGTYPSEECVRTAVVFLGQTRPNKASIVFE